MTLACLLPIDYVHASSILKVNRLQSALIVRFRTLCPWGAVLTRHVDQDA